ncbi:MAG: SDR family NAD(P)-dependent oxidoreductase [Bacteroidota bacterium]
MNTFKGKTVVITGGTDGIGAATALQLCRLGADVIAFGRSPSKAERVVEAAKGMAGTIRVLTEDFSLLRDVETAAYALGERIKKIDVLVHCVGIILARTEYTQEGLEKDFAVSYLSRFVFNEILYKEGHLREDTKLLNIAASSPKVPKYAQMEFDDLEKVKSRTGMKGHGQAQLANDIYAAMAADRYGLVAIGYGPGSVDTSIRREIPKWIRVVMKPFFKTRKAQEVAHQLVAILADQSHKPPATYFYNKNGKFEPSAFITNRKRQQELLTVSQKLIDNIIESTDLRTQTSDAKYS